jgi:claudin
MQCKVYNSMLALTQNLQADRAMTIIAIIVWVLGVSIVRAKCTNDINNKKSKAKAMIISRMIFILAVILVLVPVSWTASTIWGS